LGTNYAHSKAFKSGPEGLELSQTPIGVEQRYSPPCSEAERGEPMRALPMSSPGAEHRFWECCKNLFSQCFTPEGFGRVADPETPRSASLHGGL